MSPSWRSFHAIPHAISLVALAAAALTCAHRPMDIGPPLRPYVGPDGRSFAVTAPPEPFPERSILDRADEDPPRLLARVNRIVRQIGSIRRPEPQWESGPLGAEIAGVRDSLDKLGLGAGALMRHRLGRPSESDDLLFRSAARLYLRWGLAQMRTGEVNQRVWGAEKVRQAMEYDPENPVPVLILAGYDELAGFWSNELQLLAAYTREHGHHDAIDLKIVRQKARAWTVTRVPEELDSAMQRAAEMAERHGGWETAPPWLRLEQARLFYLADAARDAFETATATLDAMGVPPSDTLTAAQAELLLGVLEIRRLQYADGGKRLEHALALASTCRDLEGLTSWLIVPWDLMTPEQQAEFSRCEEQAVWLRDFWKSNDPILATPDLLEDRAEYLRRVGEAWFTLSGVDPGMPGPLTDAGRAFLRYGVPQEWTSIGGEVGPRTGVHDINHSWRYTYRLPVPDGFRSFTLLYQDHGTSSSFSAVDTTGDAPGLLYAFDTDFGGRLYRFDTATARFREPGGRLRLVVMFDTYLPDYTVRYPMLRYRFDGEARILSTLYEKKGAQWKNGPTQEVLLDQETRVPANWSFRRRAGVATFSRVSPGPVRIASSLTLRDTDWNIAAMGVDNGRESKLAGFDGNSLDASDLLLLSSMDDSLLAESERKLAPGWIAYGPDPQSPGFRPRAGRMLLPSENVAFYLEVYNLTTAHSHTGAELTTTLERLRGDGTMDYSVGLSGQAQTLTRPGVNQWNIARSFNLGGLGPGTYRLVVGVRDRNADEFLQRSLTFRVVQARTLVDLYNWAGLPPPVDF